MHFQSQMGQTMATVENQGILKGTSKKISTYKIKITCDKYLKRNVAMSFNLKIKLDNIFFVQLRNMEKNVLFAKKNNISCLNVLFLKCFK
jgi:hypothetical protein